MLYGYAHVSTSRKDEEGVFVQTTSSQIEALINAVVDSSNIFEDRVSGKEKSRPGLDTMLEIVQSGDVIIVWKLDRLGRSVRNLFLLSQTHECSPKGRARVTSLDPLPKGQSAAPQHTQTPTGTYGTARRSRTICNRSASSVERTCRATGSFPVSTTYSKV